MGLYRGQLRQAPSTNRVTECLDKGKKAEKRITLQKLVQLRLGADGSDGQAGTAHKTNLF